MKTLNHSNTKTLKHTNTQTRSVSVFRCLGVGVFRCSGDRRGFTFIETIIYTAIVGIVVLGFVIFTLSSSGSNIKTYSAQEVQSNSRMALNIISQKIRSATGINAVSSIFDVDPGVLSLSMASSSKNPTIIDLNENDGLLRIKEGNNSSVDVTSKKVKINNLIFSNFVSSSQKENIGIQMTVEYNNPSNDVRYNYSQHLQTSVSIRQ